MSDSRLEYLFDCYLHQNCSEHEEAELMNLLGKAENKIQFQKLIEEVIEKSGAEVHMPEHLAASILKNIIESDVEDETTLKSKNVFAMRWIKIAAAACIILFVSSYAFWLFHNPANDKPATTILPPAKQQTIKSGSNHAVLTMADGGTIVLDNAQNGNIVGGNSEIRKQGAILVYDGSNALKEGRVITYNTLSTPKGGQYELVLPDGSKVWLNASSSIPTAFIRKERNVELSGEVYFEIAKNKEKPLRHRWL